MSTVVVTGAAGFVGQHLVGRLHAGGHRVVAIARSAQPSNLPATSSWTQADLFEPSSYRDALSGADAVVHLAALTGKARPSEFVRNNVEVTKNLIEACHDAGSRRFVFVSSIAAKFRDRKHYPYAESKIAAEALVRASGLHFTIVRPTMILGPRSPIQGSLERLAGLPVVPMFGAGENQVQPIEVTDVARAIDAMLFDAATEGATLELGGPHTYTMLELFEQLRRVRGVGGSARFIHLPLGFLRSVLALLEPLLLPVLPFTAGQLASFANDSTATQNPLLERVLPQPASCPALPPPIV